MTSKSSARKRGGTFHQDNIHQNESAIHYNDEPKIDILSIVDDIPSNQNNNHDDGNNDIDEQSFEETLSRGRSRSRSIHENDGIIPYVLNQSDLHSFSNQNDNPNSYNNGSISSSSTHSRTIGGEDNSIDNSDKETKRRCGDHDDYLVCHVANDEH